MPSRLPAATTSAAAKYSLSLALSLPHTLSSEAGLLTQSQQFSDFWCSSKSHKSLWQSVRHQLTGAIVQGFNERETYSIACCMLRLHYASITETTKKDTIEMGCHC